MMPLGDSIECRYEVLFDGVLKQVSVHTGVQGTDDVVLVGEHTEKQQCGFRKLFADLDRRIDAIQRGHRNVENHQIR